MIGNRAQELKPALVRSGVRLTATVGALSIVYALIPLRTWPLWASAAAGFVIIGALVPVTIHRVRAVLTSDSPAIDAAEALVVLLAMLVLGFSAVYVALNRSGGQFTGLETKLDALYFTSATITTVGYGDVAPTGQAARAVVTLQLFVDLVFIGGLVQLFRLAARRRIEETSGTNERPS